MADDKTTSYLTPEARARIEIDRMLAAAGWAVQNASQVNLAASRGVAVREFVMASPHGRADYLLFLDGQAAGVVEAKKEGETLIGVEHQSAKYVDGLPESLVPAVEGGLAFVYESTGTETRFTNRLDPDPASRAVFSFHRPETLIDWLGDLRRHPLAPTLRDRLRALPDLETTGLWPAQFRAITNLEQSLAASRPRALIQMATGSGKTFTAANVSYRLIKHADARRILFLVDRANLGRQTLKEFQGFTTPDDGRKFTELYNVQQLGSNTIDPVSRVAISTIQRVYSILRGDAEFDEELDEHSPYELTSDPSARGVQRDGSTRDVRRGDCGRVPPLDLRVVASGARLLRRVHDRADGDTQQAGVRVLQPEPGDGVRTRAGCRGRGQRPLRRVPDPHRDHRAGLDHRRRYRHPVPGAADTAHAVGEAR